MCVWGAVVCLSACGFHLRGDSRLPPEMAHSFIQTASPDSDLLLELRRALRSNGIVIVDDEAEADSVLRILQEQQNRRVLSVDERGRAREYELSYSVTFDVVGRGGNSHFQMPKQNLSLKRDFLFDTEGVLGKGREEQVLVRDMQRDVVRLILLRLQSLVDEGRERIP